MPSISFPKGSWFLQNALQFIVFTKKQSTEAHTTLFATSIIPILGYFHVYVFNSEKINESIITKPLRSMGGTLTPPQRKCQQTTFQRTQIEALSVWFGQIPKANMGKILRNMVHCQLRGVDLLSRSFIPSPNTPWCPQHVERMLDPDHTQVGQMHTWTPLRTSTMCHCRHHPATPTRGWGFSFLQKFEDKMRQTQVERQECQVMRICPCR